LFTKNNKRLRFKFTKKMFLMKFMNHRSVKINIFTRNLSAPTAYPRIRSSLWKQPLLNVLQNHLVTYPTPSNLNISWNWGSLAGLCLVLQIITGVCLAMHYTPQVDLAFSSVQHI
jgi:hypothetical protein